MMCWTIVCCVVEQKIKEGKSFEIALQEAFNEVAPNGLDEIQRKTFLSFELSQNNIYEESHVFDGTHLRYHCKRGMVVCYASLARSV
jgi:hypothetical protein